jgi:uncharacterized protein (TIGR02391 family)
MRASELLEALDEFYQRLTDHQRLWGESLQQPIPDYPVRNVAILREQSQWLSRKLGALQPYIERFDDRWILEQAGRRWDALTSAVGLDDVAIVKGSSIRAVVTKLDKIIGRLEAINPDDDIPENPDQPIRPGADVDYVMRAYLHSLHPFIREGCSQLFLDGHYIQAVEGSAKAVFQYIRDVTGLKLDGTHLAQHALSLKNPILVFSELDDETKRNEQQGFMEILTGIAKGIRNPLAHTHGRQEEAQKAFEYLVLASLCCRRIDDATPTITK